MDPWQTIVAMIVGAGAVLGVLNLWVVPVIKAMVKVSELHPTWVDIGEHFRENGGPPLHEQLSDICTRLDRVETGVAEIHSEVAAFVTQRQKGGRRNGDPQ